MNENGLLKKKHVRKFVNIERKIVAGKIETELQLKHGECAWFKLSFLF
jgi:hypothetical protein